MEFIPLASSSRGNAYLLKSNGTGPLLLEAGIPIRMIREKLYEQGERLSNLSGCLISHEHGDHSKAVKDLLKKGIDCYMSLGTAEALVIVDHYRTHNMRTPGKWSIPQGWEIFTFGLEHDAKEPIGFLIDYGNERLLFIPDTAMIKNRFEEVTIIAVECNNINEILINNILKGYLPAIVGNRISRNHMSLESLVAMLKANDLSRCRELWLLHLSDGNSDQIRMKKEIEQATGIPVYIARE